MTARNISEIESDRNERINKNISEYVKKPRTEASQAAAEDTREVMERHRKKLRDAIREMTKCLT